MMPDCTPYGTKEWKNKWEFFRDTYGKIHPQYSLWVQPGVEVTTMRAITFVEKGGRLIPVENQAEVQDFNVQHIVSFVFGLQKKVADIQREFVVTEDNTIPKA